MGDTLGSSRHLSTRRLDIGAASRPIDDKRGCYRCGAGLEAVDIFVGPGLQRLGPNWGNTKPWNDAIITPSLSPYNGLTEQKRQGMKRSVEGAAKTG